MASPYVGEIRMFGGNFAPVGWMFCNGQLLAISEYDTLFNLIGTTYGGDGQNTFALPDLRGRVPVHQGNSFVIGQNGGTEAVTLTTSQIPSHTHVPGANTSGGSDSPGGNFWAFSTLGKCYIAPGSPSPNVSMNAGTIGSPVGGSQPHDNMIPFLCVSYIISLFGLYPQP